MTTSPGQVAGATQQAAGQTASTAKGEAAQVSQTAASAASDVAGTAQQQAGQVAGEAVNQLKSLTEDAKTQASQQAGNATNKLSETVRSFAGEVRDLGQGKADGSGTVAGLAQQLADKGEQLADYVSSQGPDGLVRELRRFAARKPGTFLLGALAAGIATGRVVKGATADSGSTGQGTSGSYGSSTLSTYPAVEPYPATTGTATSGTGTYMGAVPIVHSDDSGILDDETQAVGPVSGDDRLRAEGLSSTYDTGSTSNEPGAGLR